MSTILDLILEVQTALFPVAPYFDDEKSIARHDFPKRYVWVLDEVTTEDPDYVGGNPRATLKETWRIFVHCWGADKKEALALRQALVAVLRACGGPDKFTIDRTTFKGGEAYSVQGFVAIVDLAIQVHTFDADLTAIANGVIQDAITPTVRITSTEFESGGITGDDKLDALES